MPASALYRGESLDRRVRRLLDDDARTARRTFFVLSQIDQLADRVERLLVRHEELQRTNALLLAQVETLTKERDSLHSRLSAARSRVDALLERLPEIKNAA